MFVKRPTTLVQHAHAKSGKTIARVGNKACSWGSHDGSASKAKMRTKKSSRPPFGEPAQATKSRDYCFPINLPLRLTLSRTTMLAPDSGPSSRTR
jgi:hypothetical protein